LLQGLLQVLLQDGNSSLGVHRSPLVMSNSGFSEKYVRGAIGAKDLLRVVACGVLCARLALAPAGWAAESSDAKAAAKTAAAGVDGKKISSDPVLKVMQAELSRADKELGKTDQAPYYLSYTVYDQDFVVLVGAYGSLLTNAAVKRRQADVTMRVGTPELDNTHGQSRASGVTGRDWAGAVGVDGPRIQARGAFADECTDQYGGARGRRG
jgi:hypothetical protein